jgi:hypothetical protein
MKTYFNPGCALSIYKPEMENKIIEYLNKNYEETAMHKKYCRHEPQIEKGSLVINVCAGCDRRFRSLYEGIVAAVYARLITASACSRAISTLVRRWTAGKNCSWCQRRFFSDPPDCRR